MERLVALVVDDEKDILEHISNILSRSGFDVIVSSDGRKGIELARARKPDIIILDIYLPDLDGSEIGTILKNDPNTKHIPIIYLTGLVTKDEIPKVEKTGDSFIIAKPVGRSELLNVVNKALANSN